MVNHSSQNKSADPVMDSCAVTLSNLDSGDCLVIERSTANAEFQGAAPFSADSQTNDTWSQIELAKEQEKILLDYISKNLSSLVFRRAHDAREICKIEENIGVFPRTAGVVAAKVEIDICKKGLPDMLASSSEPLTALQAVNERVFHEQLRKLFEPVLHGENPCKPILVALSLANGHKLVGRMTLEVFSDPNYLLNSYLL